MIHRDDTPDGRMTDGGEETNNDTRDETASDPGADLEVACGLSEEERERRQGSWVERTFLASVRDVEELEDGYAWVFDGSDDVLEAAATFVRRETDCCPFATFHLEVSPGLEEVRLRFTGPDGTKELLEGGLFRNEALAPAAG